MIPSQGRACAILAALGALALTLAGVRCSSQEGSRAQVGGSAGSGAGATDTSTATAATPDTVEITVGGKSLSIFRYEAVKGATGATSASGVAPTVSINYQDAKDSCAKSGFRLCTYAEWVGACKGPANLKYGFADTPEGPPAVKVACDVARTTNNTPGSLPSLTGSHSDCKTRTTEVYDMIGNAAEWTVDETGAAVAAGAAFYQDADASICETTLTGGGAKMDPGTASTDLGFRCCKDSSPASTSTDTATGTATGTTVPEAPPAAPTAPTAFAP